MMRVILDVDGVLRDFSRGLCDMLNNPKWVPPSFRTRSHWVPQHITEYDLSRALSKYEMAAFQAWHETPGSGSNMLVMPGSYALIRECRDNVDIVTAGGPGPWNTDTCGWLTERFFHNFGGKPLTCRIVSRQNKRFVKGDVLVEDHPLTAVEWAEEHPDGLSILIDHPYNREHNAYHRQPLRGKLVRATCAGQAATLIQKYRKGLPLT